MVFVFFCCLCFLHASSVFAATGKQNVWFSTNQNYCMDITGDRKKDNFSILLTKSKNDDKEECIDKITLKKGKVSFSIKPKCYTYTIHHVKFCRLDNKTCQITLSYKMGEPSKETYIYQYKKGKFVLLHKNYAEASLYSEDNAKIRGDSWVLEAQRQVRISSQFEDKYSNSCKYERYTWKNVYKNGKLKTNLKNGVDVSCEYGNTKTSKRNLTVVNGSKQYVIKKGTPFKVKKLKFYNIKKGFVACMIYLQSEKASGWYNCGLE